MDNILQVRNLTAGYRSPIVSDISFSVGGGEIVGILGRNGQGKTTLLKGISADVKLFSGEVWIDGNDCTRMSVKNRAGFLSLLPQKTYITEGITAEEIMEMGCYSKHSFFRAPSCEHRRKIEIAAKKLGIENLLEKDCSKLSIGQQQMVLLGRMLVQDTKVLLLDEPNAALDYYNTQTLFQTLRSLVREQKKAGVLVLHDPETALRWCDRLLILDKGKLIDDFSISSADEKRIETALQKIYPKIKVQKNPVNGGYFCYLQEIN